MDDIYDELHEADKAAKEAAEALEHAEAEKAAVEDKKDIIDAIQENRWRFEEQQYNALYEITNQINTGLEQWQIQQTQILTDFLTTQATAQASILASLDQMTLVLATLKTTPEPSPQPPSLPTEPTPLENVAVPPVTPEPEKAQVAKSKRWI